MPEPLASPAAAWSPPARAAAGRERWLERLALLGVLVHAAFLPISIAGMQIGLAIALGALLLLRASGRPVWARSALDLPVLAFAGAAVLSLGLGTIAGSPPVGWHEATLWRSVLSPLVVLSALHAVRQGAPGEDRHRQVALWALGTWAVAALVPSALAWVQFWTGLDPLHALGLRQAPVRGVVPVYPDRFAAVGFFRWYQRLAHNLIPPLCVAAAVALHGGASRRLRALLGVAALAAAVAVVFTLSRMAWLSLVVGVLVVVVNVAGRARRWAVGAVLVASLAMLLHPGVQTRLRWSSVSGINDDRKAIWNVCRVVVSEHPLTGVGWGNLPRRALPLYDRLTPPEGMRAWCHDAFLSAWAEGGPLLFLALVAYWALLLRAFWRSARAGDRAARAAAAGALGALVAMLLNSLVHDIFYSSEAVYGLGFGLAIAAALAGLPARGVTTAKGPPSPP